MTSVWAANIVGKLDPIYEQFLKPSFGHDKIINAKCLYILWPELHGQRALTGGVVLLWKGNTRGICVQFLGLAQTSCLTFAKVCAFFVSGINGDGNTWDQTDYGTLQIAPANLIVTKIKSPWSHQNSMPHFLDLAVCEQELEPGWNVFWFCSNRKLQVRDYF